MKKLYFEKVRCYNTLPKGQNKTLANVWCNLMFYFVLFTDGLVRRMIRGEEGVSFDRPLPTYDQKDFVPIEVKAGSMVVIHGDLIHQRLVRISHCNSF